MKLIEKTSLLMLLPALLACTVEDPKDSTPKAKSYNYFSASASAAEVGADGGTVFLLVNSNVPWQISADRGLAPDVREGSGNGFVNITVSENPSFDARSFSYSVSTDEELDVDEPEQWTVFGRKLDFRLVQAGMEKKFQVDKDRFDLPASSVSALLVLTTNLDFQIRLAEEGLAFETVDDGPLRHLINFSFPANRNPETVTYHAEIVPIQDPGSGVYQCRQFPLCERRRRHSVPSRKDQFDLSYAPGGGLLAQRQGRICFQWCRSQLGQNAQRGQEHSGETAFHRWICAG